MPFRIGSPTPSMAKLVERQMRNWELAKTQRSPSEVSGRTQVEDFVCISREVGADAESICAVLGERLGWPVFDKEILGAMAGDDAIRRQIYASMDERDMGWCEESLRALVQPEFVKNDYFHKLTETVLSLARQGSGIFLGRGADLILPQETGVRVRVVAPPAARIQRFAAICGIVAHAARTEIRRLEEDRAAFIRRHFHIDSADPGRFDLVINLARISTTRAVELIMAARTAVKAGPD